MSILSQAACWAFAMLFVAAGIRLGFMDRDAGTIMLFVLPILAVTAFRSSGRCTGEAA